MSTPKHTPGPWGHAKSDFNDKYSIYANGPLATSAGYSDYGESALANAHLLASAPELLEACKAALHTMQFVRPDYKEVMAKLKKVIRKAEGRKPYNQIGKERHSLT